MYSDNYHSSDGFQRRREVVLQPSFGQVIGTELFSSFWKKVFN